MLRWHFVYKSLLRFGISQHPYLTMPFIRYNIMLYILVSRDSEPIVMQYKITARGLYFTCVHVNSQIRCHSYQSKISCKCFAYVCMCACDQYKPSIVILLYNAKTPSSTKVYLTLYIYTNKVTTIPFRYKFSYNVHTQKCIKDGRSPSQHHDSL